MTDAEMIEWLRQTPFTFNDIVADRIEQLKRELSDGSFYKESAIDALYNGKEAAEAKLAKAVEALREMMEDAEYPDAVWEKGAAVLAELEKTE